MRIIRGANLAMDAVDGYRKTKKFVDDHHKIQNPLMDAHDIAVRVVNQKVEPSDVHQIKHGVKKSIPYIYKAVVRHVQRQRARQNEET